MQESRKQNNSSVTSNSSGNELKKDYGDVGWETVIIIDPSNVNDVKRILCGKVTKAIINSHKVHIVGIKGNGVKPGLRASEEQKSKCHKAHLKRTSLKR